jgi:2-keto-4-pentenoate hydratase
MSHSKASLVPPAGDRPSGIDPAQVAESFVGARRRGAAIEGFPGGSIPTSLEEAYRIQDVAIGLWPDRLRGWKVGRIADGDAGRLGADRLVGPIFDRAVWQADGVQPVRFPVFEGGFAAVEAEYVAVVGADADPAKPSYTVEEAAALIGALHVGIETAGSPLATINQLGPTVVVSDFGNNAGLIVGPEIAGWRDGDIADLRCETFIDGERVGTGGAANLPGGPVAAFKFALEVAARRGRPLRRGDLVSTGATTGIHDIVAGQTAHVRFSDGTRLDCIAEPAAALD